MITRTIKTLRYALVACLMAVMGMHTIQAQQVPLFNQYFYSNSLAYPSGNAFDNDRYISLVYRDQYGGLVGAPQNFALAYRSALKGKKAFNLNATSSDIGFTSQIKFSGGIGYRLFGDEKGGLSVGSQLGVSFFSLNDERFNPENPVDNALANLLGQNGTALSLDISATYIAGGFKLDLAVPNVVNESLSDDAFFQINDDNVPDFIGGASYAIRFSQDLVLTPYAGVRVRETVGTDIDVFAELNIKDKVRLNAGYRGDYGLSGGIGLQVAPKLMFTYTYDVGQSDVPFLADAFNEFGLHWRLNDKEELEAACIAEGQSVVNRIVDERMMDESMVLDPDKLKALCYLESLEEGKRKEVKRRGEEAYKALFARNKELELARIEAERVAKLEAEERARQDSIRRAEAEAERLRLAEEARRRAEAEAQKVEEIKEALSLATESVSFNSGSDVLTQSSFASLDEVAKLLSNNPEVKLALEGHTDNTGNPESNMTLSQKRADAVKAYLVDRGIAASRITSEGFGITKPRASNSTRDGRALNRRVEMKIIQ